MNLHITRLAKILLVVVMGNFVAACDEEDSEKPNTPDTGAIPKIASLSWINNISGDSGWKKFTYDAKGRIAKEERRNIILSWDKSSELVYEFETVYKYTDAEIVATRTELGDTEFISSITTYQLNNKGLVKDEYIQEYMFAGSEPSEKTNVRSYVYDENGYLKQVQRYGSFARITEYVVSDQNIHRIKDPHIEYYYDKTNTLGLNNYGISFFGKDSKNLYKRGGPPEWHDFEYHEYEFDAKGRPVKDIQTYQEAGQLNMSTYTYVYTN